MLSFIASFSRPAVRPQAASRTHPLPPRRPSPLARSAFAGAALFSALTPVVLYTRSHSDSTTSPPAMTLSELTGLKDIEGKSIDTASFKGKVVFAMNVASACGYTKPGYDLLKRLTDKYSADDFVAIAIPCNSFGWQENGSPDEIKTFALARAEKLVITERSEVNGNNPHPIVGLAKSKFPGRIMWNFDGRFVFDRDGVPAAKFGNSASADDIEAAIDKCI